MSLNDVRNYIPEQVEKDHSKHPFGEYGRNGKHLYHESDPPLVVYNAADEAAARKKGYSEEYIPQDYPKAMYKTVASKNPVTGNNELTVAMAGAANQAEEKALAAKGWK